MIIKNLKNKKNNIKILITKIRNKNYFLINLTYEK